MAVSFSMVIFTQPRTKDDHQLEGTIYPQKKNSRDLLAHRKTTVTILMMMVVMDPIMELLRITSNGSR